VPDIPNVPKQTVYPSISGDELWAKHFHLEYLACE